MFYWSIGVSIPHDSCLLSDDDSFDIPLDEKEENIKIGDDLLSSSESINEPDETTSKDKKLEDIEQMMDNLISDDKKSFRLVRKSN